VKCFGGVRGPMWNWNESILLSQGTCQSTIRTRLSRAVKVVGRLGSLWTRFSLGLKYRDSLSKWHILLLFIHGCILSSPLLGSVHHLNCWLASLLLLLPIASSISTGGLENDKTFDKRFSWLILRNLDDQPAGSLCQRNFKLRSYVNYCSCFTSHFSGTDFLFNENKKISNLSILGSFKVAFKLSFAEGVHRILIS